MIRIARDSLRGRSRLARRLEDAAILAAGIALALPLILPFA